MTKICLLGLTGRHNRDFSRYYTVQTEVRQSASHNATRKSEVLEEETHFRYNESESLLDRVRIR